MMLSVLLTKGCKNQIAETISPEKGCKKNEKQKHSPLEHPSNIKVKRDHRRLCYTRRVGIGTFSWKKVYAYE